MPLGRVAHPPSRLKTVQQQKSSPGDVVVVVNEDSAKIILLGSRNYFYLPQRKIENRLCSVVFTANTVLIVSSCFPPSDWCAAQFRRARVRLRLCNAVHNYKHADHNVSSAPRIVAVYTSSDVLTRSLSLMVLLVCSLLSFMLLPFAPRIYLTAFMRALR